MEAEGDMDGEYISVMDYDDESEGHTPPPSHLPHGKWKGNDPDIVVVVWAQKTLQKGMDTSSGDPGSLLL